MPRPPARIEQPPAQDGFCACLLCERAGERGQSGRPSGETYVIMLTVDSATPEPVVLNAKDRRSARSWHGHPGVRLARNAQCRPRWRSLTNLRLPQEEGVSCEIECAEQASHCAVRGASRDARKGHNAAPLEAEGGPPRIMPSKNDTSRAFRSKSRFCTLRAPAQPCQPRTTCTARLRCAVAPITSLLEVRLHSQEQERVLPPHARMRRVAVRPHCAIAPVRR
jgi:hypothetical protein